MVTALLDFSRELGDLILQSCFLEAIKRKKTAVWNSPSATWLLFLWLWGILKLVEHGNRLPREVAETPSAAGHGPEQPVLAEHSLNTEVGLGDLQGSLTASSILRFCASYEHWVTAHKINNSEIFTSKKGCYSSACFFCACWTCQNF